MIETELNINLAEALAADTEIDQMMGIIELGDNPELYSAEIMLALSQSNSAADSKLAAFCKQMFPFFSNPYKTTQPINIESFSVGNTCYKQEQIFLKGIRKLLGYAKENDKLLSDILSILTCQTAIIEEYRSMILQILGSKAEQFFQTLLSRHSQSKVHQLGFVPTYGCNLSCEYCFSKNKHAKEADQQTVHKILDWAQTNNISHIRLYGGEPTSYHSIEQLLNETAKRGIRLYFASNCIINDSTLKVLNSNVIESIHAHVQSPLSESSLYNNFWKNVKLLSDKGIEIILRYNLIDEEWSFIPQNGQGYVSDRITFAPVVVYGSAETFSEKDWQNQIKLIKKFVAYIEQSGFTPILARPQPLCFAEKYMSTKRWDIFTGNCTAFRDNYMYNNLIWPNGQIALCDGDIVSDSPKIFDFSNWEELSDYIRPRMLSWLDQHAFPECSDCYFKERALCQGACLASKNR